MYWVSVGDSEKQLVGLKEKDFFLKVFRDCCRVEEINLPDSTSSFTISGDE